MATGVFFKSTPAGRVAGYIVGETVKDSYEYEYNEKQKSILPINYQKKEIKDSHTACGDYLIEIDEFAKE